MMAVFVWTVGDLIGAVISGGLVLVFVILFIVSVLDDVAKRIRGWWKRKK